MVGINNTFVSVVTTTEEYLWPLATVLLMAPHSCICYLHLKLKGVLSFTWNVASTEVGFSLCLPLSLWMNQLFVWVWGQERLCVESWTMFLELSMLPFYIKCQINTIRYVCVIFTNGDGWLCHLRVSWDNQYWIQLIPIFYYVALATYIWTHIYIHIVIHSYIHMWNIDMGRK